VEDLRERVLATLLRSAELLEECAQWAEEHAQRYEWGGALVDAAAERQAAGHAREVAAYARAHVKRMRTRGRLATG
jgi:hypothetical protein